MADEKLGFDEGADKICNDMLYRIRSDLRVRGKSGEVSIKIGGFKSTAEGVFCELYVNSTWIKVKVYDTPCIYNYRNEIRINDYIQPSDFAIVDSYFRDSIGNSANVEQVLLCFPDKIEI